MGVIEHLPDYEFLSRSLDCYRMIIACPEA
jgi:hypothetical protein